MNTLDIQNMFYDLFYDKKLKTEETTLQYAEFLIGLIYDAAQNHIDSEAWTKE